MAATVALGAVLYFQLGSGSGKPTASPAAAPQRVSLVNGLSVITLDAASQQQSGLQIEALTASNHQPETIAYGAVLDLQPLIELRTRFMALRAEAEAATAATAVTRQEFERSRVLYQDNQNVSLKAFQTAEAAYLVDRAKMGAAQAAAANMRAAARQQFGEPLGGWALNPGSAQFDKLLNRQEVVLRISIAASALTQAPAIIQVAANDAGRSPAYLVSPATQSDPAMQGAAFLYRSPVPLASGSNVVAWLPVGGKATTAVLIPARAIVWYGGQPWAYVQVAPDRFTRRPVDQHMPLDGTFFVRDGFKAGDRVVVSGAQLLLSEELRPPPGSPACKDPECD